MRRSEQMVRAYGSSSQGRLFNLFNLGVKLTHLSGVTRNKWADRGLGVCLASSPAVPSNTVMTAFTQRREESPIQDVHELLHTHKAPLRPQGFSGHLFRLQRGFELYCVYHSECQSDRSFSFRHTSFGGEMSLLFTSENGRHLKAYFFSPFFVSVLCTERNEWACHALVGKRMSDFLGMQ